MAAHELTTAKVLAGAAVEALRALDSGRECDAYTTQIMYESVGEDVAETIRKDSQWGPVLEFIEAYFDAAKQGAPRLTPAVHMTSARVLLEELIRSLSYEEPFVSRAIYDTVEDLRGYWK